MSTFRNVYSSVKYHAITRPAITQARHLIDRGVHKVKTYLHDRKVAAQGRKVGLRAKILKQTRPGNVKGAYSKTSMAGMKRRAAAAKAIKASRSAAHATPTPAKTAGPSIRSKVLGKTRGALGANKRLWSKNTIAGQKRRQAAANAARGLQRPLRARTGKLASTGSVGPQAGSGKIKRIPRPKTSDPVQAAINSSKTHGELRRKVTGVAVRSISAKLKGSRSQKAVALANYRKEHGAALRGKVKAAKSHYLKQAAEKLAKK